MEQRERRERRVRPIDCLRFLCSLLFLRSAVSAQGLYTLPPGMQDASAPRSGPPSPGDVGPAFQFSDKKLKAGDLRGARQVLYPAIKAHPDVYNLNVRYAYLSYLLKDYETAEICYRRAAALDPNEATPVEGLFYTALAKGDNGWTIQARRLLELKPQHVDARLRLAFLAFQEKRFVDAAEDYGKALQSQPRNVDALTGLGWSEFYRGDYGAAKERFQQALALAPDNASAKQGLAATPDTWFLGVGATGASLVYSGLSYKKNGTSEAAPVTIAYKDRWSLTAMPIHTVIHYTPPTPDAVQDELDVSASLRLSPMFSLSGAYDHIAVNDTATRNGNIGLGGFYYTRPPEPEEGLPCYVSLGGYYANSQYPQARLQQWSPLLAISQPGAYSLEADLTAIQNSVTRENLSAMGFTLTVGPISSFTFTGKGYTGKKRLPVEEWGLVVANTQDLYRGGFRAMLAWTRGSWTLFGLYGGDAMTATNNGVDTDYDSTVAAAGVKYTFGL